MLFEKLIGWWLQLKDECIHLVFVAKSMEFVPSDDTYAQIDYRLPFIAAIKGNYSGHPLHASWLCVHFCEIMHVLKSLDMYVHTHYHSCPSINAIGPAPSHGGLGTISTSDEFMLHAHILN